MIVYIYEVPVGIDLVHLQDFSIAHHTHSYPSTTKKSSSNSSFSFSDFTFVGEARFRLSPQTVQRVGDVLQLLADRLTNWDWFVGETARSRFDGRRVGDADWPRRRDGELLRGRSLSSFWSKSTSFLYISRSSSMFLKWTSSREENESFFAREPPVVAEGVEPLVVRRHFCNSCRRSFSVKKNELKIKMNSSNQLIYHCE